MPETTLCLPPEGSPPWQERHHRSSDMVHALEMSKMLTEMAPFLEAEAQAEQKLWGQGMPSFVKALRRVVPTELPACHASPTATEFCAREFGQQR